MQPLDFQGIYIRQKKIRKGLKLAENVHKMTHKNMASEPFKRS
jgi:hypothetical protein